MKKALLFSGLLLALLIPLSSYADSGACSYHGGVKCSAGPDWDGSVVCNDGWRDSSVSYSSMAMCRGVLHYCTTEQAAQLDQKYGVDAKKRAFDQINAQLEPYIQRTLSGAQSSTNETIEILRLTAQHQGALSDLQLVMNQSERECYALGEQNYYEQQTSLLRQYYSSPSPSTQTQQSIPASVPQSDPIERCLQILGPNGKVVGQGCGCAAGFTLTAQKNYCVPVIKVASPTVSEVKPIKQTEAAKPTLTKPKELEKNKATTSGARIATTSPSKSFLKPTPWFKRIFKF